MSSPQKLANLVRVKTALAEKWEHQAKISGSRPAQATFTHRARKYRMQAADCGRKLEQLERRRAQRSA